MQLLLALAFLLCGGDVDNILKEAEPLLKNLGGEELKKTLEQAKELSGIIDLLQKANGPVKNGSSAHMPEQTAEHCSFPLAPVAGIADSDILCCFTKYFSDNP